MVDEVVSLAEKVSVKCHSCGYVWKTNSKLNYVTCPNCMRKVNREKGRRLAEQEVEG